MLVRSALIHLASAWLRAKRPGTVAADPDDSEHNWSRRVVRFHRGHPMTDIKEHMEVIGADGVHVGTVDKVEGNRIKLTKKDSGEGSHKGHHHFIDKKLVAEVEGNKVRLSAVGAVAVTMEEEK
jgi:hypothetical protein